MAIVRPARQAPVHSGAASNKILKDIVVKSQTVPANDPYVVGWYYHGLPISLSGSCVSRIPIS